MDKLGWNRSMEIVHLEHWVRFMEDRELEMMMKEKTGVLRDKYRVAEMTSYELEFLNKDIDTLAFEMHRRKFTYVLYKMMLNLKIVKILGQMHVYYAYHPNEAAPSYFREETVENQTEEKLAIENKKK